MKSIQEEMDLLAKLQERAKESRKSADADIAEVSKRMKALQERIENGSTTGDKIKDFVLARYGFLSDGVEGVYRDIAARVAKSAGEFVFVFSAWGEHAGCTGFGGRGHYVPRNNLYLGVLEKGQVDFSVPKRGVIFPTKRHIVFVWRERNTRLVNEDLSENLIEIGFWRTADFWLNLKTEELSELILRIGDEGVNGWFGERTEFLRPFYDMCQALGRPNEEFFKRFGRIIEHILRQP